MSRNNKAKAATEFCRTSFQLGGDEDDKGGTFRGFASVFNTPIDAFMPTVIEPGAFTKTLQENASRVRILLQHDPDRPIGKPLAMNETSLGLEVQGKISDTNDGRDALELMRDGVLTDISIGFDPIKWEIEENGEGEKLRRLKEVRLHEFSLVTWGANAPARVSEVNSAAATQFAGVSDTGPDLVITTTEGPGSAVTTEAHELATEITDDAIEQYAAGLEKLTTQLEEADPERFDASRVQSAIEALRALTVTEESAAEPQEATPGSALTGERYAALATARLDAALSDWGALDGAD